MYKFIIVFIAMSLIYIAYIINTTNSKSLADQFQANLSCDTTKHNFISLAKSMNASSIVESESFGSVAVYFGAEEVSADFKEEKIYYLMRLQIEYLFAELFPEPIASIGVLDCRSMR